MKTRMASWITLVAATAALASTACDAPGFTRKAKAPEKTAPKTAAVVGNTTTTSAALPASEDGFAVKTNGLAVSDAIVQACGITSQAKGSSPSFEYDSAALGEDDRVMLGEVARCLTEGALKGRNVTLTGRADRRGEPEYNMTLGEFRSDGVMRYMVDLGVGRTRMKVSSRGEMDATGQDEEGYAKDRRVDIELVP